MIQNLRYDHNKIEKKWQNTWKEDKTFKAEIDPDKPKYYILDMFPYPSGAGLHVGHVAGYTATDILARYKRLKGFNVLHPMGWDSFGLPAEQYAMRTGTHPAETTQKNIDNFRRQLQELGFSYDWDREVQTSDPKYYKWTQWIFTKLYEKGLAYEADVLVNYCPELGTVLANEEVENGLSKEGGYPVERHPLRQWVLKITEYADRLIEDLDLLDWPESLKKLQMNWIGRSEGVIVDFLEESTKEKITVFTTRPDTLFGATYMVLSPEHPLVDKITTPPQDKAVQKYKKRASAKSDFERSELAKEKTGVWTGTNAINPVNGELIPIWIADYVLISYGTGAIMAVPAHDQRDFDFAQEFNLPIVPVFDPHVEKHPEAIPEGVSSQDFREQVLAGKQCWSGGGTSINSQNEEVILNGHPVEQAKKEITEYLVKNGTGKPTVHYKLRDWLFSRQRYWGEPFPILHFKDGTKRVLDLDELPLCPPEIEDYKPSGDGHSPLAKVRDWVEVNDSKTKKKAFRETNTMPQWAGSCWYYLRFCDPHNEDQAWSPETEKYWGPVDMYVGGVEHAVLHLLYARFWHKVLFDCGYVSTPEPFMKLRNQGLITSRSYRIPGGHYVEVDEIYAEGDEYFHKDSKVKLLSQVEKMSKSKMNGVTPDIVVEDFGADALRLYEMFMGPLEKEKVWSTDAVSGCRRFLTRLYDITFSEKVCDEASQEALKLGHRCAYGVANDIENLSFNTAIAKMMEFVNDFSKLPSYPRSVLKMIAQALSPFAPHMAEEMWEHLGGEGSVAYAPYPEIDLNYLRESVVTYVIQVNGRLRGRVELPRDQDKDTIYGLATENPNVSKHLDGEIKKVIFVPNKLLNIVLQPAK
ncbi:MAG: leucyl-tRNA synthetase [Chlamydiales bacterium]|jgi:leucyl-tRNA synthetase